MSPRWKHKMGGTTYVEVGRGRLQTSGDPESDYMPVVICRSEAAGELWVRPVFEFEDGRFERLPDTSPPTNPAADAIPDDVARAIDVLETAAGWLYWADDQGVGSEASEAREKRDTARANLDATILAAMQRAATPEVTRTAALHEAAAAIGRWKISKEPNPGAMTDGLARELVDRHHALVSVVQDCQQAILALINNLPAPAQQLPTREEIAKAIMQEMRTSSQIDDILRGADAVLALLNGGQDKGAGR